MKDTVLKKVIGFGLAAMLTSSMAAGGVWAFLHDYETSSNNVLAAGTIDLSPSTSGSSSSGNYTLTAGGDQANGSIAFQKLQPGETGNVTWVLIDAGTIGGALMVSSNVSFNKGTSTELKTASGDGGSDANGFLDAFLGVKLRRGVGTDQSAAAANLTYLLGSSGSYAAASGLQAALNAAGTTLAADGGNDTVVYVLNWELSSLFGGVNPNIVQGDGAQVDITFILNQ